MDYGIASRNEDSLMTVAEAFVKSKLAPYEGRIRAVIDGAWADYL
jgi:hypothetical protein